MKRVFALLLVTLLASPASAQGPGQSSRRIVTTTRLVTIFSQLEDEVEKAIQQKDQTAIGRLLSEDFQEWTPAPPGNPIAREDWLQQTLSANLQSFQVRQMAVRSVTEDVCVVSFVLRETIRGTPRQSFIVDLWGKSGENWQLTDRYLSPIAGSPASPKAIDKRPTGRN